MSPTTEDVIAFAAAVADPAKFAACAAPGLERAMRPQDVFAELTVEPGQSLHQAYDEVLDHFAGTPGLEGVVLLHEDTEILDPGACETFCQTLSFTAVAGVVGGRGAPGIAWWEGEIAGRCAEPRGTVDGGFDPVEVDTVDGLLLALSPWAVEHLRFSFEGCSGFHGYDAEICAKARAAGARVAVMDVPVFHHTKGGYGDRAAWERADRQHRERWGHLLSDAWRPTTCAPALRD